MSSAGPAGLNKRRPSFPSASSTAVLNDLGRPQRDIPRVAWGKHLKYVGLGGVGVWYFDMIERVRWVLAGSGWTWWVGGLAVGLHGLSVAIFLYLVLFLPWIRGYILDYSNWQQFARMRILVPLLTASIFLGWTAYVVALSQVGKPSILAALGEAVKAVGHGSAEELRSESGLGVWRAMVGTTAMWILTMGCIGLIPTPAKLVVASKDKQK